MEVTVRQAGTGDLDAVLAAVLGLLRELTGDSRRELPAGTRDAACAFIRDRAVGTVLVATTAAGEVVGVLGASCQVAIRTGGRYLLIQELYVFPAHRGGGVGDRLIRHLVDDAIHRGVSLIEVGPPGSGFTYQSRTLDFYRNQGFTEVGPRMRWIVSGKGKN